LKLPVQLQLLGFGIFILIAISALTAFSAGISISNTSLDMHSSSVSANQVKPAACAGLNLTSIITGAGTVTGTPGNDLILGSSGPDTINGLSGDDCILGGGGNDSIDGNSGTDACLGGPDSDTFNDCESEIQ
jgi:Ca2+-binding RTX toxin-like protein